MELVKWQAKKACSKRELISLIGQQNHAAKSIRPGRTFLSRLIDLSCLAKELHYHIHLNVSARVDIAWWCTFCSEWNGVSLLTPPAPSISLFSDASGSWGLGAICSPHCSSTLFYSIAELFIQQELQICSVSLRKVLPPIFFRPLSPLRNSSMLLCILPCPKRFESSIYQMIFVGPPPCPNCQWVSGPSDWVRSSSL